MPENTSLHCRLKILSIVNSYHQLSLEHAVEPLTDGHNSVLLESIQDALSPNSEFSLSEFSSTIVGGYVPATRGIFRATYPPGNSQDLFRLYIDLDKSVYPNFPCPNVHLTPDKHHAYLHLGPVVASFTTGGASNLEVPSTQELASQ